MPENRLEAHELGACLYVPASHPHLQTILANEKLIGLRTLIVCTEDAIAVGDLPRALANLANALAYLLARSLPHQNAPRRIFVRPRNPLIMRRILAMPGADRLAGFVFPKITAINLIDYLHQMPAHMQAMPTLETREAFSDSDTRALLRKLEGLSDPKTVVTLRIGGNDLLALLRLRRPRGKTIYETPLGHVISRLATTFLPYGYSMSAPVYEYLDDFATLHREIDVDLSHGLVGKTAIHPRQVPLIESHYAVQSDDIRVAEQILDASAPGVFAAQGAMCEPATHRSWATEVLAKARNYGHSEPLSATTRAL